MTHAARARLAALMFTLALGAPTALAGDDAPGPKVLLLPADFKVMSLATASTEEVPEWSQKAEADTMAALARLVPDHGGMTVLPMPELSAEEKSLVDAQVAFYDVVAGAALGSAHEKKTSAYTLGPSLAFLRERSGADKAIVVIGADAISTGGRMFLTIVAAAGGIGLPGGMNFISVGMIDLATGNIEWLSVSRGQADLTELDTIMKSLDGLLCAYPGATSIGDELPRHGCARKFKDGEVYLTPEERRALADKKKKAEKKLENMKANGKA